MAPYVCSYCNYKTNFKSDFNKHLKTKKHRNNSYNVENDPESYGVGEKMNTNEHKMNTNEHKSGKVNTNEHKMNTNLWNCEFCEKPFKSKPSMKRHIKQYCKKTPHLDYKKLYIKSELEKEELYSKMSKLIEKVGDTNIQNNIILNSYGSEDTSHISDAMKTEFLKIPFCAIPKLIEHVHFNENKPENHNIILPNKRDNKIMVFSNNKWVYKDKDQTIIDLVDSNYNIIDDHYEKTINGNLSNGSSFTKYTKFRKVYDEGDKEFIDKIKKECELVILNNRKKYN